MLSFATYSWNFGTVPVDLLADDPKNIAASTVSQCVSWASDYVCRERRRVGGFEWYAEHRDFHCPGLGVVQEWAVDEHRFHVGDQVRECALMSQDPPRLRRVPTTAPTRSPGSRPWSSAWSPVPPGPRLGPERHPVRLPNRKRPAEDRPHELRRPVEHFTATPSLPTAQPPRTAFSNEFSISHP